MFKIAFSMRTTLGHTVGLMGLLGLGLALATGELYRDLAVENQRAALADLVELKSGDLLRELDGRSRDLGLAVQGDEKFRRAYAAHDLPALVHVLDSQFHQYFVTAEIIALEKLLVFDPSFRLVAASRAGAATSPEQPVICPDLISRARLRNGAERVQVMTGLCQHRQLPYHVVVVPVGGLRPTGYLAVISDPAPALRPIESTLGMPLRLRRPDGTRIFQTDSWPPPDSMSAMLVAEHSLRDAVGAPVLVAAVSKNLAPLYARLARTRTMVMALAGLATMVGVFIALVVLEHSTLQPLRRLTDQLRRVRHDRSHLGEQVRAGGPREIRELAADFNKMTAELKQLYSTLEQMAYTDPLTSLPNRVLFQDYLSKVTGLDVAPERGFTLFLMDLDRFKQVNDTLGHLAGDQLLQEVGGRLKGVLRDTDVLTRLQGVGLSDLSDELVARLGGDEFAAILPTVSSAEDAALVAQKLLKAMEDPFQLGNHTVTIGLSIGIVLYPANGLDGPELMQRADIAMYHAKNNRQGYAFFDHTQEQLRLL